MNKRNFLKASGALLTGSMLTRLVDAEEQDVRKNWAGNYTYHAKRLHSPKSVEEVQQLVKNCSKVKALGSRHSFDRIADTSEDQISLLNMGHMELDRHAQTVTVDAGVKYGQLAPYLDRNGYAVHNLASLPHITVAGACATGTHGSGDRNGNLSTAATALELVTARGELRKISHAHDGEQFQAAVVGLGALGVVTRVTLKVQPTFQVAQTVYENLPLSHLEKHLDDIFGSGYSVSLFTDWQNHRATQVWIKRKVEPGAATKMEPTFFDAKLATRNLHPLAGHSAENCTEQMGVPGPWHERLPHFRMNFTPSSGEELQTEYFVPREHAYQAILAVEKLKDRITPHLFISELRTIAADDLWMSPAYKRPSLAIHFTWKPEWTAVKPLLPQIETSLAPFNPRPHWAKLFTLAPEKLKAQYEKLPAFQAELKRYDPNGKFRNAFLDEHIYAS